MGLGFHSLVEVLLRGGATAEGGRGNDPMNQALRMRRHDLVTLLVEHGYDPAAVDMCQVFDTWDPTLMEFFIDRGADVKTTNPLAYALCSRIRTTLPVFKRHRDRFPSFQEQANIALRHHCVAGNMKWVSLLLWAGTDLYAPGVHEYNRDADPECPGWSALEYAALYGHFEVFDLKKIRLDPEHPAWRGVVLWASKGKGLDLIKRLLDQGWKVNDEDNGGSSALRQLLQSLDWGVRFRSVDSYFDYFDDSSASRDRMRAIQMLVEHGGRWTPKDKGEVNDIRRGLLKLKPQYTAELVLIFTRHRACAREDLTALLRTPSMKSHLARYSSRIDKLLSSWGEP